MNLFSFFERVPIRPSFVLAALLALPITSCSSEACPPGSSEAACTQRFAPIQKATPMDRQTADDLGIPPFVGEAVVANPLEPLDIPLHPFLGGGGGDSRVHNDHYNSASYDRSGPVGPAIEVITHKTGDVTGVCAMMAMLKNGYAVGSCLVSDGGAGVDVMLYMFDNENLDIVAEQNLGLRPFVANSAGGAYFSMDADENIIIGPSTNKLEQYHIEIINGAPQFVQDFSKEIPGLAPAMEATDPMLQDTLVDYEGRIWFVVTDGRIGYYDIDTDVIEMGDLGNELENSMVVDDRGVYVVTVGSAVRASADEDGKVRIDWEAEYDAGSGAGLLPGSGSSPTLLGTRDDLFSIADNANEQINLLVLDRSDGSTKCEVPVFTEGASGTENTVIGYNDDIVIVNNAGFGGPFAPANTIKPGIERYRVLRDGDGNVTDCEQVWANATSFGNSAQLGAQSGVIWGYGADPAVTDEDLFYLTGTSWETGEEIFRTYVGDGKNFDPITGQVHIHPDGSLFLGALRGVVLMRDTAQ